MRTNIDLDDKLVARAFKASGARTKRQFVHLALEALVKTSRKKDLLDLVGKIDFDPDFDHKTVRRTRQGAD
jgi:Arc/MetJ family transcription regulator